MLDNQGSSPESYRSTASNDATSLTFTSVSSRSRLQPHSANPPVAGIFFLPSKKQ
nr:MAG TPA: hypothetical protein [Caudoviricetes sp.]